MNKILSYSTSATDKTDWAPCKAYTNEEIKLIRDPNGGQAEYPRTAIPSPFARLELTKNAFQHVSDSLSVDLNDVANMDKRLVSNALDIAQLFFNYENYKDYLHIIRWNRNEQLANLDRDTTHRIYGQTLSLFLEADKVNSNFEGFNDWYILAWRDKIIGATSPTSFIMSAPVDGEITEIKVEQGRALFAENEIAQLWDREDEDFIEYMFLFFNAYADKLITYYDRVVYAYLRKTMKVLEVKKPDLAERIKQTYVNQNALAFDRERAVNIVKTLNERYSSFDGEDDINVFGARFYHKKSEDILTTVAGSDFLITPSIKQPDGELLPLVLQSKFDDSADKYKYIDKQWNSATEVFADNKALNDRILPDTQIQYPFLTTADFLQETIIRLGGTVDTDHFFDGNLKSFNPNGYLLPIKPLFFKYFTTADLMGNNFGQHFIDIVEDRDGSVRVTLRIPVKKRFIELSRVYCKRDSTWIYDERKDKGSGRIIDSADVTMAASIFPFVRTDSRDNYTVQLFSVIEGSVSLDFYKNGHVKGDITVENKQRTKLTTTSTTYYDVNGAFDFIEVSVEKERNTLNGVILPRWKEYRKGTNELIFAVDFGTTNSHVEYAIAGSSSKPLTFEYGSDQVLVASLLKKGEVGTADQYQDIEFLPRDIDTLYGFPLRSALLSNDAKLDNSIKLFRDVNIPFLYERKTLGGKYKVTTNIKWMGDATQATEFLREIVLLIKAKALLENADLNKISIVYFYPVSMGANDRNNLTDTWEALYRSYISNDSENMKHNLNMYPESIAPAYYYKRADVTASSYVSIDIGGGTCDSVVYQPAGNDSKPVAISSFRFAGNAIFGDAFKEKDAGTNPLISHYAKYFSDWVDRKDETRYLKSILDSIMEEDRSEDINAFMFSIENVEQVRNLRNDIDRNHYSYNDLLRKDKYRKLIFMYFYAAIIYYIASAMKARNLIMPKRIFFSGTGSKILNILGRTELVSKFTKSILEKVFGEKYPESDEEFDIRIEAECPKQITCRGGIKLENERIDDKISNSDFAPEKIRGLKYCYSMIGDGDITIDQLSSPDTETCQAIIARVKDYNKFFIEQLCDSETKEDFGIENGIFSIFTTHVEENIANYLTEGINCFLSHRYKNNDIVEDVPFFYPLIGSIRYNLLKYLRYTDNTTD
jgi:hypothetical protein